VTVPGGRRGRTPDGARARARAPRTGPPGGPVGPVDASLVPRFTGPATFARLPGIDDSGLGDVAVAVVGVPFDGGVSYRPGARFGPAHVREASRLLRPFNPATGTEPFAAAQVVDAGDVTANPFSIDTAVADIERGARELLDRAGRLVVLGGDHTVALPLLRAVAARHGPVAVVHFDAHLDTWDTYFGAAYTHGTPFRRAVEEGLIDREAAVHVGVRGPLYGPSDLTDDAALGFRCVPATEFDALGAASSVRSDGPLYGPSDLTDDAALGFRCVPATEFDALGAAGVAELVRARVSDRPVYVSVDIDVLDPAFAPGTGTPEAGGLTSRELLAVLRGLAGTRVVGADVVEVSPAYDHAQITAVAASHVAYELLTVMAAPGLRAGPRAGLRRG